MKISVEQERILDSFVCERLSANEENESLINSFASKRGSSLVSYFEKYGPSEDKDGKTTYYVIKTKENEILMFLRKVSKQKNEVSLDEALNVDGDGNELLLADVIPTNQTLAIDEAISNEKERMMYEAVEKLNAREREIITLRFGLYKTEELTQKEVADKLGISQSYISRLEKKIIDKLKLEMEKKLTIVSK